MDVLHPAKLRAGIRVVAVFPLLAAGQVLGVIYVYLRKARSLSRIEWLALENLAHQAAAAILDLRRLAAMARREEEVARLKRAGLFIASRPHLGETLDAVLQMALEITGAEYGNFRLLDKSGQNLLTAAIAGKHLVRPVVEPLPLHGTSIMGWVAQHRQALCIDDLHASPWVHIYQPLDRDLDMRSELVVPLIDAGGRLEGVLNLESPATGAFGERESHLLEALAAHAVISIQQVRLLSAVQEIAGLLQTQPPGTVLDYLTQVACDLLGATASAIWLLEDDHLMLQSSNRGHRRGERLPLHGSLIGRAVLDRAPVTSDDVRTDARFQRADLARTMGWAGALIVPLFDGDDRRVVGAFSAYGADGRGGRFADSDWDRKSLAVLGHYATLGLQGLSSREAVRIAEEQRVVTETFAVMGDIAANLLHHLNNKLGAIPLRVEGIQEKSQAALQADSYLAGNLAEIERSTAEAMQAMHEGLSLLHPIHLVPVDPGACVQAGVAAAGLPLAVQVRSEGLEHLPLILASPQSLTQVVVNLLQSAAEAMSGQGVVAITGVVREGKVELSIADSGPGLPPEAQQRIFEPGYSCHHPAGRTRPGSGLWWVKVLMARLGGSVAVESAPGRGTTFRLTLAMPSGDL